MRSVRYSREMKKDLAKIVSAHTIFESAEVLSVLEATDSMDLTILAVDIAARTNRNPLDLVQGAGLVKKEDRS